jgi:hypothetical protein
MIQHKRLFVFLTLHIFMCTRRANTEQLRLRETLPFLLEVFGSPSASTLKPTLECCLGYGCISKWIRRTRQKFDLGRNYERRGGGKTFAGGDANLFHGFGK